MKNDVENNFILKVPREIFKDKLLQRMLSDIGFESIECNCKTLQNDLDKFHIFHKIRKSLIGARKEK
jgi:ASC-1-like (ASCH) protein